MCSGTGNLKLSNSSKHIYSLLESHNSMHDNLIGDNFKNNRQEISILFVYHTLIDRLAQYDDRYIKSRGLLNAYIILDNPDIVKQIGIRCTPTNIVQDILIGYCNTIEM